jgi:hypothetical protein
MPEPTTELEKLKRENESLRSLVRRAFPMVRAATEQEILEGGIGAVSKMGVSVDAQKWMKAARTAGCAPQGRPLRGSSE